MTKLPPCRLWPSPRNALGFLLIGNGTETSFSRDETFVRARREEAETRLQTPPLLPPPPAPLHVSASTPGWGWRPRVGVQRWPNSSPTLDLQPQAADVEAWWSSAGCQSVETSPDLIWFLLCCQSSRALQASCRISLTFLGALTLVSVGFFSVI